MSIAQRDAPRGSGVYRSEGFEPYRQLALAVLLRAIGDLKAGGTDARDARDDVAAGRLRHWLDALALPDDNEATLHDYLHGLVAQVPRPSRGRRSGGTSA